MRLFFLEASARYVSSIVLKEGVGIVWGSMIGAVTRIPLHSLSLKTIREQSMASQCLRFVIDKAHVKGPVLEWD